MSDLASSPNIVNKILPYQAHPLPGFLSYLLTVTNHPYELLLLAFFGGYLSGSVPYGLILSKLAGVADIRKVGSGNIGATNVLRAAGKKIAAITLLLDVLKGAVPVAVALHFHQDYAVLAALGAFFGHLFPVWLKFKGGKGVATALGVCFAFSPALGGMMCGIWLIIAGITHYSSAAALAIFGFAPMLEMMLDGNMQIALTLLIMGVAIWIRHAANIKRLLNNTESKINFDKSAAPPASAGAAASEPSKESKDKAAK